MTRVTMVLIAVIGISLFTGVPGAAAQCRGACDDCGLYSWQGVGNEHIPNWVPSSDFNPMLGTCTACEEAPLVTNGALADEIATLISSSNGQDLRALVTKHRDRLLLHPSRNLIVVLGSPCDSKALNTMVAIPGTRAAALASLGVRSLEDYLHTTLASR